MRNLAVYAHVIELVALRWEADFDVSQTLAIRQLIESLNAELIYADEMFDTKVAVVPFHAMLNGLQRHEVHGVSKHKWA